jgi:predicted GIY-YIG superfamily endonuclease
MQDYFVYILASRRNGTLYVGVTNDLARRVHEHRTGAADGFTRKHNVKRLVWYETHSGRRNSDCPREIDQALAANVQAERDRSDESRMG